MSTGRAGVVATSLLVAVAGAVPPAGAAGPDVCGHLGAAALFTSIGARSLRVDAGVSYGGEISWGSALVGGVCVGRAQLQGLEIDDDVSYGDGQLVAAKPSGTAVSLLPGPRNTYLVTPNHINGDLVTGGGLVRGTANLDYLGGTIDTTGTHPLVASCNRAIADAAAASAAFAAMAPGASLGNVFVKVGESLHVDASASGGVVEADSITLDDAIVHHTPDVPRVCYGNLAAALYIDGGTNPDLVVNAKRLAIGNCAYFEVSSGHGVVNVPGPGPGVRIGIAAQAYTGTNILAPQRTLVIEGTGDDTGTNVARFWARRVLLRSLVTQTDFSVCP